MIHKIASVQGISLRCVENTAGVTEFEGSLLIKTPGHAGTHRSRAIHQEANIFAVHITEPLRSECSCLTIRVISLLQSGVGRQE